MKNKAANNKTNKVMQLSWRRNATDSFRKKRFAVSFMYFFV